MNISMAQISPVNMKERADLGIKPGDTTRVWIKVQEKGKTRLQPFEGLVLARKHGSEPGATFTVRKVASGVGIEKIFPLYSPNIDKIEIVRRAKVRRAKLYYIRDKAAREIRRQMRNMKLVQISTQSDIAEKEAAVKADKEAKQKAVEGAEAVTQQKEVKEKKEEKSISAKEAELQSEETEDSKVETSVEEKKT